MRRRLNADGGITKTRLSNVVNPINGREIRLRVISKGLVLNKLQNYCL